jgi:hypothetical protein
MGVGALPKQFHCTVVHGPKLALRGVTSHLDDDTSGVLVYNFNKGPNDPIHCRPIALATALTYLATSSSLVFTVRVCACMCGGATLRAAPAVLTAWAQERDHWVQRVRCPRRPPPIH